MLSLALLDCVASTETTTMGTTAQKLLEQTLDRVRNTYDKASIDRFQNAADFFDSFFKCEKLDSPLTNLQRLLAAYTSFTLVDLSPPISVLITGLLLDRYLSLSSEKETENFAVDEHVRKLLSNVAELYKFEMQLPWRKVHNSSVYHENTLQYLRSRAIKTFEQSFKRIQSTKKQHENHCKLLVSLAESPAALIIKLVDRISILKCLKPDFAGIERTALRDLLNSLTSETLNIHVPIAERLGIWKLKWPLQDLAFRIHNPDEYQKIINEIATTRTERDNYLKRIMQKIEDALKKAQIPALVEGRSKSIYSIYHKKVAKNLELVEMNDLLGVRIIIGSDDNKAKEDCYRALDILLHNENWDLPVAENNKGIYDDGKFSRDWIASPKPNGYQSIHTTIQYYPSIDTTILYPSSDPTDNLLVEVQIRTKNMHKIAEYGIAAHWGYKEKEKIVSNISNKEKRWNREQEKLKESIQANDKHSLKLFEDERFCLTPKGEVLNFPKDATPVDFAYRIHGEIGNRLMSVKVNNNIAPYSYKLKNGDIVEIITSKDEKGPKEKWLSQENEFVKGNNTKYQIRRWFRKHLPQISKS